MVKTDLWTTRDAEVDFARHVLGEIDLDPCASFDGLSPVQMRGRVDAQLVRTVGTKIGATNYTHREDGLSKFWFGRVFMNPPYSALWNWTSCAAMWHMKGVQVLGLLPVSPSTRWWQAWTVNAAAILFPAKRIEYDSCDGEESGARHDSCWVLWGDGERVERFRAIGKDAGMVLTPISAPLVKGANQSDMFAGRVQVS